MFSPAFASKEQKAEGVAFTNNYAIRERFKDAAGAAGEAHSGMLCASFLKFMFYKLSRVSVFFTS